MVPDTNGTNLSLERIKRTPNPSSPSLLPAGEGRQNRSFDGSGKGVGTAYRVEKCAHGSGKILKLVPLVPDTVSLPGTVTLSFKSWWINVLYE